MALDFASGQNVSHSTLSGFNMTAYTVIQWVRFDSWVNNSSMFKKGAAPTCQFTQQGTSGNIEAYRDSTGSDHWAGVTAPMSLSTWYCVAVTFDTSDGLRIFIGSLTTPMAEATYAYRQVGDTSIVDNSAMVFSVGGYASALSIDGQIAWTAVYSSRFSLPQLIIHQRYTNGIIASGCKLLVHYGIHGSGGVGTQLDLSGNAHNGTITGATKADHAPLSIFTSYPTSFYKARLGEGYQRDWGLGLNGIVTSADKVEHVPLPIFVTKGMQPTPITVADLNVAVTSSNPDYQGTGVKVD